jgi:serine/threonine protein kinase/predicted Zn-dependent protease
MIGKTISQYRILEKLGEGGMGEVFLAEDTELNRKVALKFLVDDYASDEDLLARFKQEAQAAAGLHHPNIITVYEVGQHEDRPYIAMAYVEGDTLSDIVKHGDLRIDDTIDAALQICAGLGVAHDAGVIHRDIKPDNIFLNKDGRIQILDFGLAKLGGVSRITGPTSTFGTIYFMSPEQVRGEQVDRRSDIFSFGTVLYEMLTGELPFKGDHSAAIIYSITNEDPVAPSKVNPAVPRELDAIVLKALAKSPEDRYQSVTTLAEDLHNFRMGKRVGARAPRSNLLRVLVPTSAVFLAVLMLVLFNPFKVEIAPDNSAVAAQASLAIMYFDNVTNPEDPNRLGEIITDLLITDLSESEYMDVVSSQRLYDILKLQGLEGEKSVDQSTASAVAKHAGAKWMLLGKILQEAPSFVITSQLVDVKTGRVSASQRVTGQPDESIFALVDRLTTEIKTDLTLPDGGQQSVAQATTHSAEAYRHYLEGVEFINKYYGQEAKHCLMKALELDSTFAMAYMRMATDLVGGNRAQQREYIDKAMKYSAKATSKERLYIQSVDARLRGDYEEAMTLLEKIAADHPDEKDAYKALGDICRGPLDDPERSIAYYRKAIAIDPMDKFSYNVLAYTYQSIDDIENYIWAIYEYMSLAPDEANPHDSRADLFAYSGKIDKAIVSYEKALARKPDFYPSLIKLGLMHVFTQNYRSAAEAFDKLVAADDPQIRSEGRFMLALVSAYQGKWDEALRKLDEARQADVADGYKDGNFSRLEIEIYRETGRYDLALKAFERALPDYQRRNPDDKLAFKPTEIVFRALAGQEDEARSQLADHKNQIEATDKTRMDDYWFTQGLFELAIGEAAEACESFSSIKSSTPRFSRDYFRGVAFVEAGRYAEAVQTFERVIGRFSEVRGYTPVIAVKAYYYLGVAYEEYGRSRKAVEQYATFIDIWKKADLGMPELDDAENRLRALKLAGIES